MYLIHLLSRVEAGITSAKDEDGEFDALRTAKDLRFSEGVFEHAVHALWPPMDRHQSNNVDRTEKMNSLVASTLKLIRGVKTCEDAEMRTGRRTLYTSSPTSVCSRAKAYARREVSNGWTIDRAKVRFCKLPRCTHLHYTRWLVDARRWKPLEVGGPPRIGDCSLLQSVFKSESEWGIIKTRVSSSRSLEKSDNGRFECESYRRLW